MHSSCQPSKPEKQLELNPKPNRPTFYKCFRQYFKAAYYYLDEPHRTVGPTGCNNMPNWEEEPGPDGSHSGAISVEDFLEEKC